MSSATAAALGAVDPPATVLVVEDDPGVPRSQAVQEPQREGVVR